VPLRRSGGGWQCRNSQHSLRREEPSPSTWSCERDAWRSHHRVLGARTARPDTCVLLLGGQVVTCVQCSAVRSRPNTTVTKIMLSSNRIEVSGSNVWWRWPTVQETSTSVTTMGLGRTRSKLSRAHECVTDQQAHHTSHICCAITLPHDGQARDARACSKHNAPHAAVRLPHDSACSRILKRWNLLVGVQRSVLCCSHKSKRLRARQGGQVLRSWPNAR
jgi:hypothetical protein